MPPASAQHRGHSSTSPRPSRGLVPLLLLLLIGAALPHAQPLGFVTRKPRQHTVPALPAGAAGAAAPSQAAAHNAYSAAAGGSGGQQPYSSRAAVEAAISGNTVEWDSDNGPARFINYYAPDGAIACLDTWTGHKTWQRWWFQEGDLLCESMPDVDHWCSKVRVTDGVGGAPKAVVWLGTGGLRPITGRVLPGNPEKLTAQTAAKDVIRALEGNTVAWQRSKDDSQVREYSYVAPGGSLVIVPVLANGSTGAASWQEWSVMAGEDDAWCASVDAQLVFCSPLSIDGDRVVWLAGNRNTAGRILRGNPRGLVAHTRRQELLKAINGSTIQLTRSNGVVWVYYLAPNGAMASHNKQTGCFNWGRWFLDNNALCMYTDSDDIRCSGVRLGSDDTSSGGRAEVTLDWLANDASVQGRLLPGNPEKLHTHTWQGEVIKALRGNTVVWESAGSGGRVAHFYAPGNVMVRYNATSGTAVWGSWWTEDDFLCEHSGVLGEPRLCSGVVINNDGKVVRLAGDGGVRGKILQGNPYKLVETTRGDALVAAISGNTVEWALDGGGTSRVYYAHDGTAEEIITFASEEEEGEEEEETRPSFRWHPAALKAQICEWRADRSVCFAARVDGSKVLRLEGSLKPKHGAIKPGRQLEFKPPPPAVAAAVAAEAAAAKAAKQTSTARHSQ